VLEFEFDGDVSIGAASEVQEVTTVRRNGRPIGRYMHWLVETGNEMEEPGDRIVRVAVTNETDVRHSPGGLITSTWRLPSTRCEKCADTLSEGSTSRSAKFEGSPRALTRSPRLPAGLIVMGVDSLT
jgi:hypothetical protein